LYYFFFSSRRRHTRFSRDWSSDVCSSDLVAIKGKALAARGFNHVPPLNNRELFRRDRHVCAYCGGEFSYFRLTRDHITPLSRGRSEERRVGKEGGDRRSPEESTKETRKAR